MKKLLFILSVVFLFCFGSAAYAIDSVTTIDGYSVNTSVDLSTYTYWILGSRNDDIKLILAETPIIVKSNGSITSESGDIKSSTYSESKGAFVSFGNYTTSSATIFSSNHDIYSEDGELVFQAPPVVAPAPEVVTLEIVPRVMTMNLKILLPLGLVVLAILLGVRLVPRFLRSFL